MESRKIENLTLGDYAEKYGERYTRDEFLSGAVDRAYKKLKQKDPKFAAWLKTMQKGHGRMGRGKCRIS